MTDKTQQQMAWERNPLAMNFGEGGKVSPECRMACLKPDYLGRLLPRTGVEGLHRKEMSDAMKIEYRRAAAALWTIEQKQLGGRNINDLHPAMTNGYFKVHWLRRCVGVGDVPSFIIALPGLVETAYDMSGFWTALYAAQADDRWEEGKLEVARIYEKTSSFIAETMIELTREAGYMAVRVSQLSRKKKRSQEEQEELETLRETAHKIGMPWLKNVNKNGMSFPDPVRRGLPDRVVEARVEKGERRRRR